MKYNTTTSIVSSVNLRKTHLREGFTKTTTVSKYPKQTDDNRENCTLPVIHYQNWWKEVNSEDIHSNSLAKHSTRSPSFHRYGRSLKTETSCHGNDKDYISQQRQVVGGPAENKIPRPSLECRSGDKRRSTLSVLTLRWLTGH